MLPDPQTCRTLARAVTEAGKWRWLPGMLATGDAGDDVVLTGRVIDVYGSAPGYGGVPIIWEQTSAPNQPIRGRLTAVGPALPDLTDPLTAAGALPVFRAAYADDGAYVARDGDEWVAWAEIDGPDNGRDGVGHGPTELEATIAAILAAPLKESPDAPLR